MRSDTPRGGRAGARAAAVVAATLALGILAAACGGGSSRPGVANLGGTTTAQASGGSPPRSKLANALRYSQCMRAHGIPDFPDPSPSGSISLSDQPGSDLDPWNQALQAAQRSCARLYGLDKTSSARSRYTAQLLRLARCVRAHGVPTFPDPSSLGPWGVGFLIDRRVLDPHSPLLQAAITACERAVGVNAGFKSYG